MTQFALKEAPAEQSFLRKHSLSIVLLSILTVQTVAALLAGRHVFVQESAAQGTAPEWGEFWIWFFWEYNLSLLADTFGVVLIVLLSKRLIETGSAESKESPEDESPGDEDHEGEPSDRPRE